VVNVITRDDYQGWEIAYGVAETDSGGGDRDFGSLMFGHAGDNWKLVANFSFNNRDNTFNRDFEWTEPAIDPFANNFTDLDPEWGFDYYNFTALPGGCNSSDAFSLAPWPSSWSGLACVYDVNRELSNETSVDTAGFLVRFEYDFSANWTAWLDASASETESVGVWPPTESWFHSPIPSDSPNNPTNPESALYDPVFGPNRPVNYWHRFESLGNIVSNRETRLGDVLVGATAWLEPFELDFGLRFTRSESEDFSRNMIRPGVAQAYVAEGTYDLQDPWGNSDEVLDAIRHDQRLFWEYDQDELFATTSWDWLEIGKRPLSWVVGGEFRNERWSSRSENDWNGPPTSAERNVLALYFETLMPLGDRFELSLAGRYDDYSDWGDNFAPKVSLRWQVLDQLVLRGSWGEGFRAPEIDIRWDEVYEGPGWTQNDPRSCEIIGEEPGCLIYYHHIDRVSPALGPEQSDQYSLGLVWQPVDAFNMILDYYDIKIEDEITYNWADLLLWMDYAGESPPPGLGVERDPQTGMLLSITTGIGNRNRIESSGFDLTLNLDFTIGPGRWHSNFLGSYNLEDKYNGWDAVGLSGVPQYRATLSNHYDISVFTLVWNVHYIASQDGDIPDFSSGYVPSWTTHDFQFVWNTSWNGRLDLGMQNAFNEQPVLDVGATGGNRYNTLLYDAFGRTSYARYTQVF
jgi:iron complex outermembrane receptor protein